MRLLVAVAVAALCALTVEASADTVYLTNGDSVWGREVTEEGETVIVVRPSGTLRFPKRDVKRIERERMSIPKHYDPPTAQGDARDEGRAVDRPVPPPTAPPGSGAGAPAPTQTPAATTAPAGAPPPASGPSQVAPTVLPPPPPPPSDRPR